MPLKLLLSLALLGTSPVAAAGEWRLFDQHHSPRGSEASYADLSSIRPVGDHHRVATRLISSVPAPIGAIGADFKLEVDCSASLVRVLEATAFAADGRVIGRISEDKSLEPATTPKALSLVRLVCGDDRSAFQLVPPNSSPEAHAAQLFATRSPAVEPTPRKVPPGRLQLMRADRIEDIIRDALAERCGSDLRCRQLEARIHRGVEPAVAVEAIQCVDSNTGRLGSGACSFRVRHPRTKRSFSCSVELFEEIGPHDRYWSNTRILPSPPEASSTSDVPSFPAQENTLRCSGDLLKLVSE